MRALWQHGVFQAAAQRVPVRTGGCGHESWPRHANPARPGSLEEIVAFLEKRLGAPRSHPQPGLNRSATDAIVRMYPRNFLGIVTGKRSADRPIVNFDCHFVNESAKMARIRRLEAFVTPPGSIKLQLMWNLFYESSGGVLMKKTADASALEVVRESSTLIGGQFVGPQIGKELLWPPGIYEFEFLGWVNRPPRVAEIDLRTSFQVEITPMEANYFMHWAAASDRERELLGDPDSAIAIPLAMSTATIAVA
jgi:hypothetical protein